MDAKELVKITEKGPVWCLNLDVISPASRRAPGFGAFLAGTGELRVTYSDMEAGGRQHRVARPRELVVVKDDSTGPAGAVVGVGEITANYHNPENPFLKIFLRTKIEPPIPPAEIRATPGGELLSDFLERPVLFEIIEA